MKYKNLMNSFFSHLHFLEFLGNLTKTLILKMLFQLILNPFDSCYFKYHLTNCYGQRSLPNRSKKKQKQENRFSFRVNVAHMNDVSLNPVQEKTKNKFNTSNRIIANPAE
jgi:hypothetical protein